MHGTAGAVLSIDLAAIQANFRQLEARTGIGRCAGVVKADAYGLGAAIVAPALVAAGCPALFVAFVEEGLAVRSAVPDKPIYLLHGLPPQGVEVCISAQLTPVLYSLEQIKRWQQAAYQYQRPLPAILQIDTGMSRLGLTAMEMTCLRNEPSRLQGIDVRYLMTHFACSEQMDHPQNAHQLTIFQHYQAQFPAIPTSLANSSALFLPAHYHGDLARPGMALYGLNPTPNAQNPMQTVVRLWGRVLQIRDVPVQTTVGYGATFTTKQPSRLATIAVGYADGYLRHLSNRGTVAVAGQNVPVVGVVSMDMIIIDISNTPPDILAEDDFVELIGEHIEADALAKQAGTIGYELFTHLGARYQRVYSPSSEIH